MKNQFKTTLLKKHPNNKARVTQIETPHGEITTPCFMPVGTRAFVNHMTPNDLIAANSEIILGGNTYHMLLSPGMDVIKSAGGMHPFMNWRKPMLTDSGGFQVFSLSKNSQICKINENGARFKHPTTGQIIELSAKTSIEAQKIIGADIIMAFDECTPEIGGMEKAIAAMERTHRWLMESKEHHHKNPNTPYGNKQALFGIIQGGSHKDLRLQSMEFILKAECDGIAIGGEVIGFDMKKTVEVIHWIEAELPDNKTRYTMGVGLKPQDLIDVVAEGIDIFDCVAPTRNARHGSLYCGEIIEENNWLRFKNEEDNGKLLIKKSIYAKDEKPIHSSCRCYTCQNFTRAYLHFLFKSKSAMYCHLASIHNVHVMQEVCIRMKDLILRLNEN